MDRSTTRPQSREKKSVKKKRKKKRREKRKMQPCKRGRRMKGEGGQVEQREVRSLDHHTPNLQTESQVRTEGRHSDVPEKK